MEYPSMLSYPKRCIEVNDGPQWLSMRANIETTMLITHCPQPSSADHNILGPNYTYLRGSCCHAYPEMDDIRQEYMGMNKQMINT